MRGGWKGYPIDDTKPRGVIRKDQPTSIFTKAKRKADTFSNEAVEMTFEESFPHRRDASLLWVVVRDRHGG